MPHRVEIPADELQFTFSRSSGKGGQNVNKVSTRVTLRWEFGSSRALSESQKRRIASSPLLARRIVDGAIVLHEERERQQGLNRKLVIEKLHELLDRALAPRKRRIPTKPPSGAKEERLDTKRRQSKRKDSRRWRPDREG
ncbi:MAG TPA: alternative ribosome rescue aminoacyl-tRNA hydrolase ArfB [Planctomycetota bacterium]|nr:alternative ribosome rescue aminoacyl-tRNA hydrolase ArfB [Planctomycetota bacterium]